MSFQQKKAVSSRGWPEMKMINGGNERELAKLMLEKEKGLSKVENTVRRIIEKVKLEGNKALIELTEKFDGVKIKEKELKVSGKEIEEALKKISGKELNALKFARKNLKVLV